MGKLKNEAEKIKNEGGKRVRQKQHVKKIERRGRFQKYKKVFIILNLVNIRENLAYEMKNVHQVEKKNDGEGGNRAPSKIKYSWFGGRFSRSIFKPINRQYFCNSLPYIKFEYYRGLV